jgi:predicted ATPase/class 3 adenylate cyclase
VERGAVPTGTVVFLFSDIEGSTQRWDAYGEAMREALRRHDEILRSEIEARRGYVFKTIGDAFCAAFSSVADALEAAVRAQRRLAGEDFEAVDGLRVRMAIDAGVTDERDGDYFGPAVNRIARLTNVGHGGQVLLSGFAADFVTAAPVAGIGLRNLGTLALRGLREPERVYQAVAAGLPSEFKELRAVEPPPNNLPREMTSFVGRDEDAARVERLLREHRIVTIAGAGGIGKTRLAVHVAANRLDDEADGVWFADLAEISDGTLAASALLAAVGAEQGTRTALDALLAHLAKLEALLVLDNCEHVVAGAARVVAAIVAACPRVLVLATSREALDVSGEWVYRLGTLDLQASVALFDDRAAAADSAYQASAHRDAVEDICRRLDGIALAIELAAARVRTMPLETLAQRLELRLLAGGRDRSSRQQTMRALIDWSYDLLAQEERTFLRACSVFAGGCTLETAMRVCGEGADEWQTLETLTSLVDKSLVGVEDGAGGRRYRLLEPVRQYAREKLEEAGESADAMLRHARAFALLAAELYEEWDGDPASDWLARCESELANVRAALVWTIEKGRDSVVGARIVAGAAPIFLRLALLAEGIAWGQRACGAGVELDASVEARLRYGLSMLYNNQGAKERVLEEAHAAADLYRRVSDARGLTRALSQVAQNEAIASRYAQGRAAADEALDLAGRLADRRLLAGTLLRCAPAYAGDGDERVREMYAQSVALFRSLGRNDETARALTWWGYWEEDVGDYRGALNRLSEAHQLAGSDITMHVANAIAGYYLVLGDRAGAQPFAAEALALASRSSHPVFTPYALAWVAAVSAERQAREAARLLGYAEERLRAAGWQLGPGEQRVYDQLRAELTRALDESELANLLAEGASWTEVRALARAAAL